MLELKPFFYHLPKAELHVHLEGTLEPEQFLTFAHRNKILVPYSTAEEAQELYSTHNSDSFIKNYLEISRVLRTEEDFFDLTLAYLKKASSQGVLHTEPFIDLQTFLARNIPIDIIINGIDQALAQGLLTYGISGSVILSLRRDLSEADALKTIQLSLAYREKVIGIGLASFPEESNPPAKFVQAFKEARSYGYHLVAHAGEESLATMADTIHFLHVERIDHGILCMQDPTLVTELQAKQIPLTVCPISNMDLEPIKKYSEHPLKRMIDAGLMVTINSDDPAFFKSYIADNYIAAVTKFGLTYEDTINCARNSFLAAFMPVERKQTCIAKLDQYLNSMRTKF